MRWVTTVTSEAGIPSKRSLHGCSGSPVSSRPVSSIRILARRTVFNTSLQLVLGRHSTKPLPPPDLQRSPRFSSAPRDLARHFCLTSGSLAAKSMPLSKRVSTKWRSGSPSGKRFHAFSSARKLCALISRNALMSSGARRHHSPVAACQPLHVGHPVSRSPQWSISTRGWSRCLQRVDGVVITIQFDAF